MNASRQNHNNTQLSIKALAERLARSVDPEVNVAEVERLFPASLVMRNCESEQTVLLVCDFTGSPENRKLNGDHKFIVLRAVRDEKPHAYFLAFPERLISQHQIIKGALDASLREQKVVAADSTFMDGGYLEIKKRDERVLIWPIAKSGYYGCGDDEQRQKSEEIFGGLELCL